MVTVEDVTDDDDDIVELSSSELEEMQRKALEEKAREEAEARRLRILKSSNERMGLVEGTLPKPSSNETDDKANEADHGTTAITSTDEDGVIDETVPKSSGTSSAAAKRMAAMRRMRFKKSSATASTTEGDTTESEGTKTEPASSAIEEVDATETATSPEQVVSSTVVPGASTVSNEVVETAPASVANVDEKIDVTSDDGATNESTSDAITSTKKYQGVAKMRRRMIKERQLKQEENERNESGNEPEALQKAKQRALKSLQLKARTKPALPLYMSLVTLLLLFLAGLDVGLHQGYLDYGIERELVTVHTTLAPRQLGSRLHNIMAVSSTKMKKVIGVDDNVDSTITTSEPSEDEFAESQTTKPRRDDELEEESNIDPLFGLDLDKLTEGTGLYFVIARFAVQCHRVNLAVFYYFPKKIVTSMMIAIMQLVASPPLLCLVALVVRQLIGKAILGAKVPSVADVPDSAAGQSKDMFSMAKSFVSNAITKTFPTAALLYDAWVHVRADMYVILFGFLVGVAYVHTINEKTASTIINKKQSSQNDEL